MLLTAFLNRVNAVNEKNKKFAYENTGYIIVGIYTLGKKMREN